MHLMRHTALALLLALGSALVQPPASQQPGVTFRVEVNFVEIDATVTDAQGNFVRDLGRDDFELVEEGQPQTISAFTLVDLPVRKADPPLSRTSPIEPDVRTNVDDFNGRVILIVLDDLQTDFRRSAPVKAAAAQFVRRFVAANDLVAVIHTGSGPKAGQEFTSSQARLLAAIDRFSGQKIPSSAMVQIDDFYKNRSLNVAGRDARDTMDAERAHKARNSLSTLRAAAEFLAGIRGRRKAAVWFGEGIDLDVEDYLKGGFAAQIQDEMRDMIAAATRAGVSFYGVDARGVGAGLDEAIDISALPIEDATGKLGPSAIINETRRAQDFMRTVSTETGGFAVINQADLNGAFARIIQENSSYYLLGYHPQNERRDGRFRRVEVRVKRPGLQVRSRTGYTAPKGRAAETTSGAAKTAASPELRAALDSPIPVSGLGLRVFAAPFAGPSRKSSVVVAVEFEPSAFSFVQKDGVYSEELEVVMLPVDAAGKAQPGTRDVAPMRLTQRTYDAVRTNGFRITRRFDLSPGRYQLHVAARAANSRGVGAVTCDLDVPDFTKPPIAMSGIALTSARATDVPTPPPDKTFLEILPDVPSARREFSAADTLSVLADVYDNRLSTPHRVAVTTIVTGDQGRVVFNSSDERRSDEIQGKSGAFTHTLEIPLAGFATGRYVLRVEARMMLSEASVVSRELEFSVR
jgi:VWFA-related protein